MNQAVGRRTRSLSGTCALLRLFLLLSFFAAGSFLLQAQGPSTLAAAGRSSGATATDRNGDTGDILPCRSSWVDFQGVRCTISYSAPLAALERAGRNFGFVRSEFEECSLKLETSLKGTAQLSPRSVLSRIVEASPYRESFAIRENGQGEIVLELKRTSADPNVGREFERTREDFERQWAPHRRRP